MRLYLTFGTTYGALRAEALLQAAAIPCAVVPKLPAICGACSLAVRLACADPPRAREALGAAQHAPRQSVTLERPKRRGASLCL